MSLMFAVAQPSFIQNNTWWREKDDLAMSLLHHCSQNTGMVVAELLGFATLANSSTGI